MTKKKKSAKRSVPKRKVKKYAGKTEKEWREWGEEFGKSMEKVGEDFEKRMEERGKLKKRYRSWMFETFGFIGPIIGSIISIFILVIGIWILRTINMYLADAFISMLSDFLYSNIQLFFLASLFFGYCNYFSRRYAKNYRIFSPIVNSLNIVFVIWILASIFVLIGIYSWIYIFSDISYFLLRNLFILFIAFAVIGYILELEKS